MSLHTPADWIERQMGSLNPEPSTSFYRLLSPFISFKKSPQKHCCFHFSVLASVLVKRVNASFLKKTVGSVCFLTQKHPAGWGFPFLSLSLPSNPAPRAAPCQRQQGEPDHSQILRV